MSHSYRKEKYSKIFRKPLGKSDKAKMVQGGFKYINPLIRARDERIATQKQKREDREIDEGIVADLEDGSSEGSGEDIEMLEIGAEISPVVTPKSQKISSTSSKSKDEALDLYVNAQEAYMSLSELFEKERDIRSCLRFLRSQERSVCDS